MYKRQVNKSNTNFKPAKANTYEELNWASYNGNSNELQTLEFKGTYGKAVKINALNKEVHISEFKIFGTKL